MVLAGLVLLSDPGLAPLSLSGVPLCPFQELPLCPFQGLPLCHFQEQHCFETGGEIHHRLGLLELWLFARIIKWN